jgi:polar amino acid transport system ATP-binding protein
MTALHLIPEVAPALAPVAGPVVGPVVGPGADVAAAVTPDAGPAARPAPPALSLRGVRKEYPNGFVALDDVTFDVAEREIIAILGPSGCGKSTLLRCVNGLEPIQAGTIALDGASVTGPGTDWSEVRQRVGMVFQNYELFPHLTVLGNLLLGPLKVQKRAKAEATERALELLARVGLADRAGDYPRQLSGGQKQRVAIVRALMMQPEVLLLDEITASLDPEMVREVLDVVLELAADGMTMLIVTHEMSFARAIADRVLFLDAGQIVEQATPDVFFTAPATDRAKQFLNLFEFRTPTKKTASGRGVGHRGDGARPERQPRGPTPWPSQPTPRPTAHRPS